MSGIRKTYDLTEKNYFKFFGVKEQQNLSARSLTIHYKKILTILSNENDGFYKREKLDFANRAFETLVDPITRARYILEINGFDNDVRDTADANDFVFVNQLNFQYDNATNIEDINEFILELQNQTSWIKEQIEESIDVYQNYKIAAGLLSRFYEISNIHNKSKEKKSNIATGIKYAIFE